MQTAIYVLLSYLKSATITGNQYAMPVIADGDWIND